MPWSCGDVELAHLSQVGIKLERTVLLREYIQCPAPLLLVKTVPLPSIGRRRGCESCVCKAKVQPLFCRAKWWVFSLEASRNKTTPSPLNTKPASLCNACSFLFYVWPTGSCLAWPKDVKSSLAFFFKKKTLEHFIVNIKCANLCFYVDFAWWWNRREACWIQFSLKHELCWSGWNYTHVEVHQIHVET